MACHRSRKQSLGNSEYAIFSVKGNLKGGSSKFLEFRKTRDSASSQFYASDGSGFVRGVGIGRKFYSVVNQHDGSGIVSLAFSVSLAFICKHSRWRTREITRDCCFCKCFLFSYGKQDVCNGTKGRRLWVRGVVLKRKSYSEFGNLVTELRASSLSLKSLEDLS